MCCFGEVKGKEGEERSAVKYLSLPGETNGRRSVRCLERDACGETKSCAMSYTDSKKKRLRPQEFEPSCD